MYELLYIICIKIFIICLYFFMFISEMRSNGGVYQPTTTGLPTSDKSWSGARFLGPGGTTTAVRVWPRSLVLLLAAIFLLMGLVRNAIMMHGFNLNQTEKSVCWCSFNGIVFKSNATLIYLVDFFSINYSMKMVWTTISTLPPVDLLLLVLVVICIL